MAEKSSLMEKNRVLSFLVQSNVQKKPANPSTPSVFIGDSILEVCLYNGPKAICQSKQVVT